MKWLVLSLLVSCATSSHQAFVEHFQGEIYIFKPQSKTATAKIPVLVRRTVDPEAGEIMEELLQPDYKNRSLKEVITNFVQTKTPGHFDISDPQKTFKGKVHFQGTPWGWEEWRYAIRQKNGSTIRGIGQFEGKQMLTMKHIFDAKGKNSWVLRERLEEIDAVKFKEQKRALLSQMRSRVMKPSGTP